MTMIPMKLDLFLAKGYFLTREDTIVVSKGFEIHIQFPDDWNNKNNDYNLFTVTKSRYLETLPVITPSRKLKDTDLLADLNVEFYGSISSKQLWNHGINSDIKEVLMENLITSNKPSLFLESMQDADIIEYLVSRDYVVTDISGGEL